jgi:type IV pilus assembly protein PilO
VIALAIGLLFYVLIWTPLDEDIAKQHELKTTLLKEETDIRLKVANKAEISEELDELRVRKLKIEKILPEKAELPKLLQKIYGQAKIVGLQIQKFEPTGEEAQALYTEIPVAMTLRGTYDELANFFYYVGKMERIVNIKNISISREGTFGTGELDVTCEAITYRSGLPAGGKKGRKGKKKRAARFKR